jgi:hypothetical protein
VKNAEGVDSPATSRRDQLRRAARWLQSAGVTVPMQGDDPHATIEISPLFAVTEEHLAGKKLPAKIADGEVVYLG